MFVIEPPIVQFEAACAVTATLVERVAVAVVVFVTQVEPPLKAAPPAFAGWLYLNTGCVMLWLNAGVVAPIVFACPCCGTSCVCAGNSASIKVTVSEPPVEPNRCVDDTPRGTLPDKSGRLKVSTPSPAPKVSPITAYKVAYVVLDTAEPSQRRYPVGTVVPAKGSISPGIATTGAGALDWYTSVEPR